MKPLCKQICIGPSFFFFFRKKCKQTHLNVCECVQLVCGAAEKLELISPAVGINLLACLHRILKQTPGLPAWKMCDNWSSCWVQMQMHCCFFHVGQISMIHRTSQGAWGRHWWSRWHSDKACDAPSGFTIKNTELIWAADVTQIRIPVNWNYFLPLRVSHFTTSWTGSEPLTFRNEPATFASNVILLRKLYWWL